MERTLSDRVAALEAQAARLDGITKLLEEELQDARQLIAKLRTLSDLLAMWTTEGIEAPLVKAHQLRIVATDGQDAIVLHAHKDGGGVLGIRGLDGRAVVALGSDVDGNGYIAVSDSAGRTESLRPR